MLPDSMQRALDEALGKLKRLLGENLHACLLYGSAARGDAVSGVSDLNLLIVLQESTPEAHGVIRESIGGPIRIEPFVLGLAGLERSMQAFAIKFRGIRRSYKVLHGADVFKDFAPDESLVRFECEQALRNARLRLVHAFITMADRARYQTYLLRTAPRVIADLSEAVTCAGIEVPSEFAKAIPVIEKTLAADSRILTELLTLKRQPQNQSAAVLAELHARLFRLLNQALAWMEAQWPRFKPDN